MFKTFFPDHLSAEWFIKSLFPSITEDVAKGSVVTQEQVIARAQYLDLIYTQSGTLYEKIRMHRDQILLFLLLHLVRTFMSMTV